MKVGELHKILDNSIADNPASEEYEVVVPQKTIGGFVISLIVQSVKIGKKKVYINLGAKP